MKQLQVILINLSTCFRELKFQHRAWSKSVPWDGIWLPSKKSTQLIRDTRHKNCSSISLRQHSIHHRNTLKKIPYPPSLHWFDQSAVFHLHFPSACVTGEASTPSPNSPWEEKDCVSAFIHCRDQSHFPRSALDTRWKSQDAEGKKVLAYYKSSPPFPIPFLTGDNVLVFHPLGAVSGCNLLSPALSAWVTKHFC